jgi:hypothetical protein
VPDSVPPSAGISITRKGVAAVPISARAKPALHNTVRAKSPALIHLVNVLRFMLNLLLV